MPPRTPTFQCLKAPSGPSAPICRRPFSSTSVSQSTSPIRQKPRHRDPYAIAQANARKAANISRREALQKERDAAIGDPVRGIATEYIQSMDTSKPPTTKTDILNFFVNEAELKDSVEKSKWLSTPPMGQLEVEAQTTDITPEERQNMLKDEQATAAEALRRIADLSLGSSKDLQRVNTQQAIAKFGRHNTDNSLPPKPLSAAALAGNSLEKMARVGPDTGSSEVQIAILTAKIKTLADFLDGRGKMDKVNKRNLTLLVHRRQRLLQYLRRKERGGPRWQHLVETLGLTEGTWKGEISLK